MTFPSTFDLAAGLTILALALWGGFRGIVRLVLGFAGIALGWVLAVRYGEQLALRLGAARHAAESGPDIRRFVAFALIFIVVALCASVLAWLITRALGAVKLGGANRLAGAGVGVLLAIALVCAVTIPVLGLWPPDGGSLMKGSLLAPYAAAGGQYLETLAPEPLRARFLDGARRLLEISVPKPAPAPRPR
ncbi:MAG TPA: CvpA family protein [Patescibacteria group bacterium]|nr:CvpA family protein [Patescibacteria group bacterium]